MRHPIRSTSVVAFLVLAAVGGALAAEEESPCAMCHDEVPAQMAATPHGLTARGGPSCQDCHGDGTAHMDEGDPALIQIPTGSSGEAACRSCHQQTLPVLSTRSAHRQASVYCSDCHTIHQDEPVRGNLLVAEAEDLCQTCHRSQAASFRRPHGHQLERAAMSCVSCHDPHAGSGERSLHATRSGELVCVDCHAEKRGPFVFPHVTGVTGDCMSCHEPHGSTNPMALTRTRVDQLCLECHSPIAGGTLGSQPPSVHDLRSPRWRQCTVCHVSVHGSNASPALLK
jgi:DmsE family decaheme c-type cytochrome